MFHQRFGFVSVAMLVLAASPLQAQAEDAGPFTQTFVTHHSGTFGGKKVRYRATVGSTVLTNDAGTPTVNLVSTDYVREGVVDTSKRPVIFAFAGGPSGPALAYHMRLFGPRQVFEVASKGKRSAVLRDNPDCLLDVADIVLIDPAETGFSRVLAGGKRDDFYSVNGDTASIRQFMGAWLRKNGREQSPRFVAGGSYGSVRAVRIGWDSMTARPVDGLIMTANSLMLQEMVGVVGVAANLPTWAITAVYHGKAERAGRSDQQIVDEAYSFTINEYLPALARVQDLTPEARATMAAKLQAMTGLPAQSILAKDLVISRDDFMRDLLSADGAVLTDRYDGRKSAIGAVAEDGDDNANARLFKVYMADELKVRYPMDQYALRAPDTQNWDYRGPAGASRNDWPGMIKEQMEANPRMRVFSANGLYDMQGVVGQARWLFSRTKLPRDRIILREYTGGHALYTDPATTTLIAQDIRKMIAEAIR